MLICNLLNKDPEKRPSPREFLEDKYVRMYMMSFSQIEPEEPQKEKQLEQKNLEEYDN